MPGAVNDDESAAIESGSSSATATSVASARKQRDDVVPDVVVNPLLHVGPERTGAVPASAATSAASILTDVLEMKRARGSALISAHQYSGSV